MTTHRTGRGIAGFKWPLYRSGIILQRLGRVRWRYSLPADTDPVGSETARMAHPEESALVVLVPGAEPLVSSFRARFDRSAVRGMPAHITLLYPFRHPDRVSEDLVSELRDFFSRQRQFAFRLVGVSGFRTVIYLAPEPLDPFDALTRSLTTRYPDTPPYGGIFSTPMPHLTVAQMPPAPSLDAVSAQVLATVSPSLPLECAAQEVALALKRGGRWSLGPTFELAA